MKAFLLFFLFILTLTTSFSQNTNTDGWKYIGEKPPGLTAKIFAPNFLSTGLPTRDIAITPDGKEIYFTVHGTTYNFSTILCTKYVKGKWTKPEVAPFAADARFAYTEPCISPDGKKMFFVSNRSLKDGNTEKQSYDVWAMERENNTWTKPQNLGSPINTDADEYFPSLTNDGTIYFTREQKDRTNLILRCKYKDGKFADAEKLPEQINFGQDRFNAFIAPDETYIIASVHRAKDGIGATDYYITYRNQDDTWNAPINLGDKINSTFNEYSPYVSRDGKYFFFMSAKPDANLFSPDKKLTSERLQKIHNSPGNGSNTIYWIDATALPQRK